MCPCQRWLRLHLQLHLRRVLEDVLPETLLFAPFLWQFTHGNGNNKSKVKMQIFSRHQEADSSQAASGTARQTSCRKLDNVVVSGIGGRERALWRFIAGEVVGCVGCIRG